MGLSWHVCGRRPSQFGKFSNQKQAELAGMYSGTYLWPWHSETRAAEFGLSFITSLALWKKSWLQSMPSLWPRSCRWSLWEAMTWWPEHHSCIQWCYQECRESHPRAKWEAHWYGLLCSYPQRVCLGSDIPLGESYQVWWHGEGGEAGILGPTKEHPGRQWGPGCLLWLQQWHPLFHLWCWVWHFSQWQLCKAHFLVW